MALALIGYWCADGDRRSDLPDPRDWVDPEWDEEERGETGAYFSTGTLFRAFAGLSPCRICGKQNGSVEYTDGSYVWPEGLAHYIDEHQVRLPEPLVRHAQERLGMLEGQAVELDWWLSATAKT